MDIFALLVDCLIHLSTSPPCISIGSASVARILMLNHPLWSLVLRSILRISCVLGTEDLLMRRAGSSKVKRSIYRSTAKAFSEGSAKVRQLNRLQALLERCSSVADLTHAVVQELLSCHMVLNVQTFSHLISFVLEQQEIIASVGF